jgi:hypothetical protein
MRTRVEPLKKREGRLRAELQVCFLSFSAPGFPPVYSKIGRPVPLLPVISIVSRRSRSVSKPLFLLERTGQLTLSENMAFYLLF